jgi:hypothetical protein
LLQHFPSVDYVKKKKGRRERKKKKTKRKRDDAWEQDEFVSLKSIENDRSVCVSIISSYYAELLNMFIYECLLLLLCRSIIRIKMT